MINEHLKVGDALEPHEIEALQSSFDKLKARFMVDRDKGEKATLAILLLAAYRGCRNAQQAAQIAAKIYEEDTTGRLISPPAG